MEVELILLRNREWTKKNSLFSSNLSLHDYVCKLHCFASEWDSMVICKDPLRVESQWEATEDVAIYLPPSAEIL